MASGTIPKTDGFKYITSISAGSSKTVNIPASSFHIVLFHGAYASKMGLLFVGADSARNVNYTTITLGSSITITTGTGTITVQNGVSGSANVRSMTIQGEDITAAT